MAHTEKELKERLIKYGLYNRQLQKIEQEHKKLSRFIKKSCKQLEQKIKLFTKIK